MCASRASARGCTRSSSSARRTSKPTASTPAAPTLERLALDVRGSRERLSVTLDGRRAASDRGGAARLRMLVDGSWRTDALQVVRADLLVHTAELIAAAAVVAAGGAGARSSGRTTPATISGLRIRSGVGELAVDGSIGRASADLTLLLRDGDLAEVSRAAGRPGLLPPARWSGRVHLAGTMTAPLVEAALEARANKTVAWLGFGLNALSLRAFADAHHAILHADARGRDDTRVVVDAHGEPRKEGDRFTDDRRPRSTACSSPCTATPGSCARRAPSTSARASPSTTAASPSASGELAITGNAPLQPKPERSPGGDADHAPPRSARHPRAARARASGAAEDRLRDPRPPDRHARLAGRRPAARRPRLGDRRRRPAGERALPDQRALRQQARERAGVGAAVGHAPRHRRHASICR